jgi:hypothetical protein
MTAINGFSGIGATATVSATASAGGSAGVAREIVDAIGDRVQAWVSALAPGGSGGGRTDAGTLARGGDVYGLRAMASDLSARFGGSPREEGDLTRAMEDFTRAAMIETAGLHGSDGTVRTQGLDLARAAAEAVPESGGISGIAVRLEAATAALTARAG